jgi:hypothetical protein
MRRTRTARHGPADRRRPPRASAARTAAGPRHDTVLAASVLAVLLVLAATGDDRHAGLIADGRQMIRTAVALAETGGIGQARGRDFTIDRAGGDAVSRFGMATSLLQVPAAWAAGPVETRLGAGRSQALFLVVPWLAVGLAAAAAGAITRRLGGHDVHVVAAVILASLASPLGSYALVEFSEPVQAAALTLALALALATAQDPSARGSLAVAAGAAAGLAVLAKSSLVLAAPAALLPLVDPADLRRTRRAIVRAAMGALPALTLWAIFDIVRFGQLFGGYPDDRFTHPWLDGVWRLLVGPNRGLVLFWPALALFVWAAPMWRRTVLATPEARAWVGAAIVLLAHLAVAAGYWGWHGMEGWGPRLMLASIPLLAPFAATAAVPRPVLAGTVGLCLLVNLPPLLQHPTPVSTYVMNLAWPVVSESEAPRFPFYATARTPMGEPTVIPFEALEREAAANPWRLYLWIWRASRLEDGELARRLREPPWRGVRPDLVPAPWPPDVARQVVPPPRAGFLGRSLTGTGGPYATVYADALLDQVVRANQQGHIARALTLSDRRLAIAADGEAAAWRLETLRRAGRPSDAEALLRSLPLDARQHPLINVTLALFDRDSGEEARARALLESVAESFPGTPLQDARRAPLGRWPPTLDAITAAPRRDAAVLGER